MTDIHDPAHDHMVHIPILAFQVPTPPTMLPAMPPTDADLGKSDAFGNSDQRPFEKRAGIAAHDVNANDASVSDRRVLPPAPGKPIEAAPSSEDKGVLEATKEKLEVVAENAKARFTDDRVHGVPPT